MQGNVQSGALRLGTAVFAAAILLTIGHRLYLAVTSGFPFNDGALFLVFVQNLASSFPSMPAHVDFNGISVPFAYPPLSFWIGALLTRLGLDALDVVHFLPILVNTAYILLFAVLLRRMGCSRLVTGIALLFLLSNIRSFEWLVMGGGLSRGMGSAFFMLTMLTAHASSLASDLRKRTALLVLCGLTVGAAILSHPEFGINAATAAVVFLWFQRTGIAQFVRNTALVAVISFVAILPWLGVVLTQHGLEPFLAASQTSERGTKYIEILLSLLFTAVLNPFVLIGVYRSVRERDYLWVVLLALICILTPRHAMTPAALPIAILSAKAFVFLVEKFSAMMVPRVLTIFAFAMVLFLPLDASYLGKGEGLQPLSDAELAAMEWVRENAPGTKFVVWKKTVWEMNSSAEWMPVLTGATSISAVQGREWLPDNNFQVWSDKYGALRKSKTCKAFIEKVEGYPHHDFVWAESRKKCFKAPRYDPVYANEDVSIFKVR